MTFSLSKVAKITLGLIGTVLLGAVGSGLWERFLGPSLDWLTRMSVGAIAWGHSAYRDSIYESAAKGFHEAQSLALYSLIISLLPFAYLLLLQRHPIVRASRQSESMLQRHPIAGASRQSESMLYTFILSRGGYWAIMAMTVIVMVTVAFNMLRLRHINETITYSLAAFEIVRPTVGEDRYRSYRSRYFSMRTASEFESLHSEMRDVAESKKLVLPDYEPL